MKFTKQECPKKSGYLTSPDVPAGIVDKCIRLVTQLHPLDFVKRRSALAAQLDSYRRVQMPVTDLPVAQVDEARALSTRDQPEDEILRERAYFDYMVKMYEQQKVTPAAVCNAESVVAMGAAPKETDAERWARSRAEALAVTKAKGEASLAAARQMESHYDPYASQRHKRGSKSHLAAAINQNIHDNPAMGCVWFVILFVLIAGCFAMAIFK